MKLPDQTSEAGAFLPLTPIAFEIVLSLARGARHGYAVMRDIEARTGGAVSVHAGTLYRAIARMVEDGLIEELDGSPDADDADARRRYYGLTAMGVAVAAAEAARLEGSVAAARAANLLGRAELAG